jgi:hypothetical protein
MNCRNEVKKYRALKSIKMPPITNIDTEIKLVVIQALVKLPLETL